MIFLIRVSHGKTVIFPWENGFSHGKMAVPWENFPKLFPMGKKIPFLPMGIFLNFKVAINVKFTIRIIK